MTLGLAGNQFDQGDFGGRTHTHRRAPVTGTAADINPGVLMGVQTGYIRLGKSHQQIPWEKLTAVGMARNLQIISGFGGIKNIFGLVR